MTAIMKSEPTPSDREVLTGLVERVTYQNAREWLLRPAGQGPWPMYFGIRDREDGFRIQNAASYRWTKGHANGIEEAGSPSPPGRPRIVRIGTPSVTETIRSRASGDRTAMRFAFCRPCSLRMAHSVVVAGILTRLRRTLPRRGSGAFGSGRRSGSRALRRSILPIILQRAHGRRCKAKAARIITRWLPGGHAVRPSGCVHGNRGGSTGQLRMIGSLPFEPKRRCNAGERQHKSGQCESCP